MRAKYRSRFELVTSAFGEALRDRVVDRARECMARHSARIEAEQCLIGAIFINNDAFAAIKGLVAAEDFFEPINREIFNISGGLIGAGKLANPITVKTFCHLIS